MKKRMTEEEAETFREKLLQIVNEQTTRLDDPPSFQLTGDPIPDDLLKEDKQE